MDLLGRGKKVGAQQEIGGIGGVIEGGRNSPDLKFGVKGTQAAMCEFPKHGAFAAQ